MFLHKKNKGKKHYYQSIYRLEETQGNQFTKPPNNPKFKHLFKELF